MQRVALLQHIYDMMPGNTKRNANTLFSMYVIEKMRLNRFELKPIVSARALVASRGMSTTTVQSQCGSDCFDAPNIDGASKTKLLGLVDEMARSAYAKHISAGKSPDMTPKEGVDL